MRFETVAEVAVVALLVVVAGCQRAARDDGEPGADSIRRESVQSAGEAAQPRPLAHSKTCRDCHEDFYKLWATSRHGLAMQPYTAAFARENRLGSSEEIAIGPLRYAAEIDERGGRVRQRGPDGEKTYPIAHAMGGKNIYYFLTPLARGRLQVLPLAYDVHKRTWYDTAASGVRHFPDRTDEALPWTDRMFTFNTTCFNCHVSQLRTNYDLTTDAYNTTWGEPGIHCESCHGPAGEHVRVMENAADPKAVGDVKIIRTKAFSPRQINDTCATCHAKLVPLSLAFRPGDEFFDHFDLIVLDHIDFYPDGRDLGENYTHTTWMMSPCAKSGKLDCNHCHTPSGRQRFEGAEANKSCAPCHQKHVDDPAAHGHHEPGSEGNGCIGCHMPMTRFAAMNRSDHSMRPPTPATTIAFESPNACNVCHADKDARWADSWVRQWYPRDYQAPVVQRASLLDAARKSDWTRLPAMLERIVDKEEDAVYRTSLVRSLGGCQDESIPPALVAVLADASPLVRASAAAALAERLDERAVPALLEATRDPRRLVRIRAAAALAPIPHESIRDVELRASLGRAIEEFKTAMQARPDDWAGYANLGTFFMERGEFQRAVECFQTATRLEPRAIGAWVNASLAHSNLRQNDQAESCLREALKVEPASAAALFNLGLLLAEEHRMGEAEAALRAALKSDPKMAAAAVNLSAICGKARIDEAMAWSRWAHELEPDNARYAHVLVFYLCEKGELDEAVAVLRRLLDRRPAAWKAYLLLGEILERKGNMEAAAIVYRKALAAPDAPPDVRNELRARLARVKGPDR
ncbi:MAG: ammonia-forming cytochrome c nitrite reductase subunit c552 [Pirellulales bacterium]|nr:ammonia-forming cytochrome c nitrite reductase subunit c552 [Pirellulales bacterium]